MDESEMAPKPEDKKEPQSGKPVPNGAMDVEDVEEAANESAEIAELNNSLDSLHSVLDNIERQADDVKAKLLELLMSNREIIQTIKEESASGGEVAPEPSSSSESKCNHHPGKPAPEA